MFKRLFGRADAAGAQPVMEGPGRITPAGSARMALGGQAHGVDATARRTEPGTASPQIPGALRAEAPGDRQDAVPLHEGAAADAPGIGAFDTPRADETSPADTAADESEAQPAPREGAALPPQPADTAPFGPEDAEGAAPPDSEEPVAPADQDQPIAPEMVDGARDAAETAGPLAPGTLVAGRYLVQAPLTEEAAGDLLGDPVPADGAELYAVEDQRGYERCWSCGSTGNAEGQRFCIDCGAQLQNRPVVLARSAEPVEEVDAFKEAGFWYHLVHPRKQFGVTGVTVEAAGYSAEGPHHPNEDSFWIGIAGGCYNSTSETFCVIALADGMGGYAPGSGLISKEIVRTVGHGIFSLLQAEPELAPQEADLQAIMSGAIAQANARVLQQIEQEGDMGATLVTAVIHGATAYLANIGDSRAYYVSPAGAVTQITRDQSWIEQQVAAGLLSPDAVYSAAGNNVILHAVGEERVEEVADWYTQPLEPGSRLLLCSDGYWKTMVHEVWQPDLARQQPTLRILARVLVEQALALESDDNTTLVIAGID